MFPEAFTNATDCKNHVDRYIVVEMLIMKSESVGCGRNCMMGER